MADTLVQLLEFTVDGQAPDTFSVFRMRGREAISELFRFEIEAVSGNEYLDADAIIGEKACLTADIVMLDTTTIAPRKMRIAMYRLQKNATRQPPMSWEG